MKKNIFNIKISQYIFLVILNLFLVKFSFSQPMPLGIDGYVYGLDGELADSSVKFSVLNQNNGYYIESNLREGYYSVAVNGNKGDKIIVSAWTLFNNSVLNNVSEEVILNGVIHNFNLVLNLSKPQLPNKKPVIISQPITKAYEDSYYYYQIYAVDENNDTLIYSIESDNLSITINQSGFVSFLPEQKDVGFHDIKIIVSDGTLFETQEYELEVINVNDLPIITSIPNTSAMTNKPYSYQIEVYDEDSNSFIYDLIENPTGMTISNTGLISWLPTNSGIYNITINVSDWINSTIQSFTIYVLEEPNNPPIIISYPNTTIKQNDLFVYEINAYDYDNDNLSYYLIDAPNNMTLNNNILFWQTNYNDVGSHNVLLKVQDSKGSYALQNFTLKVINVNDIPIIISEPITQTNVFNYYVYDVEAIDYDNDTITYALIEKPKFMYINKDTGKIIWVPFKEGFYKVIVAAYDKFSLTTQEFYINVSKQTKKSNFYINYLKQYNEFSYLDIENSNLYLKRISINKNSGNPLLISGYNKNNVYFININDLKGQINYVNGSLFFVVPKNLAYENLSLYQNGKKLKTKLLKSDKNYNYYVSEFNKLGVFYFYTKYHQINTPKKNIIITGKINFLNSPITQGIEYEITNLKTNLTKKGITSDKFNAYAELIDAEYNDEVKITLKKDKTKLEEKTIKITGDVVREDINLTITKEDYIKLLTQQKIKKLLLNLFIVLFFILFLSFVFKKIKR
ncbi:MAG: putative Ig domain-containing protein [Candidatus Woesearchaeota archaeon]